VEWMQKILQQTGGINEVQFKDEIFEIGCSRDASADIARAIVDSGAGLIHLNKKEYGLKDIYYRYFEGGADDE
jgi:ABC-2 type transport system ATP-binding protein